MEVVGLPQQVGQCRFVENGSYGIADLPHDDPGAAGLYILTFRTGPKRSLTGAWQRR